MWSRFFYEKSVDNTKDQPFTLPNCFYICDALHKLFVIQLDKLFYENQDFSFQKLFNFLNNRNCIALGYTHRLVNNWKSKIDSVQTIIDNIHSLRNKRFAHTDKNADDYYDVTTPFVDLDKLFIIGEEIIVEAYKVIGSNMGISQFFNSAGFISEVKTIV